MVDEERRPAESVSPLEHYSIECHPYSMNAEEMRRFMLDNDLADEEMMG